MVVDDEVAGGGQAGDAGDLPDDVGLLERHRAADPRAGAQRNVRLVVEDGTGPEGRGVQVGGAAHHVEVRPGGEAERVGDLGEHHAHDRAGGHERRELPLVDAGPGHQVGVVAEVAEVAVVGEPRRHHRRGRGRRHPGEAHRQLVDRLQEPAGPLQHLGLLGGEVEAVAERVGAGGRRRAAGAADPGEQGPRVVARDGTAEALPRLLPAAASPSRAGSRRPARRQRRPARCWRTDRCSSPPPRGSGRRHPTPGHGGWRRRWRPTTRWRPAPRRRRGGGGW